MTGGCQNESVGVYDVSAKRFDDVAYRALVIRDFVDRWRLNDLVLNQFENAGRNDYKKNQHEPTEPAVAQELLRSYAYLRSFSVWVKPECHFRPTPRLAEGWLFVRVVGFGLAGFFCSLG
jgi:hypothetical protein